MNKLSGNITTAEVLEAILKSSINKTIVWDDLKLLKNITAWIRNKSITLEAWTALLNNIDSIASSVTKSDLSTIKTKLIDIVLQDIELPNRTDSQKLIKELYTSPIDVKTEESIFDTKVSQWLDSIIKTPWTTEWDVINYILSNYDAVAKDKTAITDIIARYKENYDIRVLLWELDKSKNQDDFLGRLWELPFWIAKKVQLGTATNAELKLHFWKDLYDKLITFNDYKEIAKENLTPFELETAIFSKLVEANTNLSTVPSKAIWVDIGSKKVVFIDADELYPWDSVNWDIYNLLYNRNVINTDQDIDVKTVSQIKKEWIDKDTIYITSNPGRAIRAKKELWEIEIHTWPSWRQQDISLSHNDWKLSITSWNKDILDSYASNIGAWNIKYNDFKDKLRYFLDQKAPRNADEAYKKYIESIELWQLPEWYLQSYYRVWWDRIQQFADISSDENIKDINAMRSYLSLWDVSLTDDQVKSAYINQKYPRELSDIGAWDNQVQNDNVKKALFLKKLLENWIIISESTVDKIMAFDKHVKDWKLTNEFLKGFIAKNSWKDFDYQWLWDSIDSSTTYIPDESIEPRFAYVKIDDVLENRIKAEIPDEIEKPSTQTIVIDLANYQKLRDDYYTKWASLLDNGASIDTMQAHKYAMRKEVFAYQEYLERKYAFWGFKDIYNDRYNVDLLDNNNINNKYKPETSKIIKSITDYLQDPKTPPIWKVWDSYIWGDKAILYNSKLQWNKILQNIDIESLDLDQIKHLSNVIQMYDKWVKNATNSYFQYWDATMPWLWDIMSDYQVVKTSDLPWFNWLPKKLAESTVDWVSFADDMEYKKAIFEQISNTIKNWISKKELENIVKSIAPDDKMSDYYNLFAPYLYIYQPPKDVLDKLSWTIDITSIPKEIKDTIDKIYIDWDQWVQTLTYYLTTRWDNLYPSILPPQTEIAQRSLADQEIQDLLVKNEIERKEVVDYFNSFDDSMNQLFYKWVNITARWVLRENGKVKLERYIDTVNSYSMIASEIIWDIIERAKTPEGIEQIDRFRWYFNGYYALENVNITPWDEVLWEQAKLLANYYRSFIRSEWITNLSYANDILRNAHNNFLKIIQPENLTEAKIKDTINNLEWHKTAVQHWLLLEIAWISKDNTWIWNKVLEQLWISKWDKSVEARDVIKWLFGIDDGDILALAMFWQDYRSTNAIKSLFSDKALLVAKRIWSFNRAVRRFAWLISYLSFWTVTQSVPWYITKLKSNRALSLWNSLIPINVVSKEYDLLDNFIKESKIDFGLSNILDYENLKARGWFSSSLKENAKLFVEWHNNITDFLFAQALKRESIMYSILNHKKWFNTVSDFISFINNQKIPEETKVQTINEIAWQANYIFTNDIWMPWSSIDQIVMPWQLSDALYQFITAVQWYKTWWWNNITQQIFTNAKLTGKIAKHLINWIKAWTLKEAKQEVASFLLNSPSYTFFMNQIKDSIINIPIAVRLLRQRDDWDESETESELNDMYNSFKILSATFAWLQSWSLWRMFGRSVEDMTQWDFDWAVKSFLWSFASAFWQYRLVPLFSNTINAFYKWQDWVSVLSDWIDRLWSWAINYWLDDFSWKLNNIYANNKINKNLQPMFWIELYPNARWQLNKELTKWKWYAEIFLSSILAWTIERFWIYYKDWSFWFDYSKMWGTEEDIIKWLYASSNVFRNAINNWWIVDYNILSKNQKIIYDKYLLSQWFRWDISPSTQFKQALWQYLWIVDDESTIEQDKIDHKTLNFMLQSIADKKWKEYIQWWYDQIINAKSVNEFENVVMNFKKDNVDANYPWMQQWLLDSKMRDEYKAREKAITDSYKQHNKKASKQDDYKISSLQKKELKMEIARKYAKEIIETDMESYAVMRNQLITEESLPMLKQRWYVTEDKWVYSMAYKWQKSLQNYIELTQVWDWNKLQYRNSYFNNVIALSKQDIDEDAKVKLIENVITLIDKDVGTSDLDKNEKVIAILEANRWSLLENLEPIRRQYGDAVADKITSMYRWEYENTKHMLADATARELDESWSWGRGKRKGRGGGSKSWKDILKLSSNLKTLWKIITDHNDKFRSQDIQPLKPFTIDFDQTKTKGFNYWVTSSISESPIQRERQQKDIKRVTKIKKRKIKWPK